MIVAKADSGQLIVGITPADVEDLKKNLTKVKQGNPQYGFTSLVLFMGETDQQMIDLLSTQAPVRYDDPLPGIGSG